MNFRVACIFFLLLALTSSSSADEIREPSYLSVTNNLSRVAKSKKKEGCASKRLVCCKNTAKKNIHIARNRCECYGRVMGRKKCKKLLRFLRKKNRKLFCHKYHPVCCMDKYWRKTFFVPKACACQGWIVPKNLCDAVRPTASASPSPSPRVSLTQSVTATPSRTPMVSPSVTSSRTPTVSSSATSSRTPTVSPTPSNTPSATPTSSPIVTPTPSRTPSPTPSRSPSPTPTNSPTGGVCGCTCVEDSNGLFQETCTTPPPSSCVDIVCAKCAQELQCYIEQGGAAANAAKDLIESFDPSFCSVQNGQNLFSACQQRCETPVNAFTSLTLDACPNRIDTDETCTVGFNGGTGLRGISNIATYRYCPTTTCVANGQCESQVVNGQTTFSCKANSCANFECVSTKCDNDGADGKCSC